MPARSERGDASGVSNNGKPGQGKTEKHNRPPWIALLSFLLLAVLVLTSYGIVVRDARLLLVLLILAGASLVVGGLLGFLFGIPRTAAQRRNDVATNDGNGTEAPSNAQEPSTSLEQVSDWLTKILVGAGLVELTSLGGSLDRFGGTVAAGFTVPGAKTMTEAASVSFAILGFGASYLWTRTEYGGIQARADKDMRDVQAVFDSRLEGVESTVETTKELAELNQAILKGDVKAGPSIGAAARPSTDRVFEGYPIELLEKIKQFRDWSAADWDSDPCADLFPTATNTAQGRRLNCRIIRDYKNALQIELRVESLDRDKPLIDPVAFLLHPTYGDNRIDVVQPKDNVAISTILSEGWFTVVAIADSGQILLKYSLKDLPGAPAWFTRSESENLAGR